MPGDPLTAMTYNKISRNEMQVGRCKTGMGASTTEIYSFDFILASANDLYNNKYYIMITENVNSVGNAPEGQIRQITDYNSNDGHFTTVAFGANVETGDGIKIMHESVALLFMHSAGAAMARVADDSIIAHMLAVAGDISDYDDTTMSLEAIAAAIAGLDLLTDKEKAFLGNAGQLVLNDYFNNVAPDAVPTANYWTFTQDNDATVDVKQNISPFYCLFNGGTGATDDCIMNTIGKRYYDVLIDGVTTVYLKTRIKINDLTGEVGFGFVHAEVASPPASDADDDASHVSTIHCDNDTVRACSSDHSGAPTFTDITAHFADNTWVDVEIRMTATQTLFLIDGTIRATHATDVPPGVVQQIFFATKNTNGITTDLYIQYVEVWTE